MFVLTPPSSERTPLTKTVSVTYSSSFDNLDFSPAKANPFTKYLFDCCNNVKFYGSQIFDSMHDMTYWKLILFCLFEWNFYTTMKIIYPFNEYFANYYGIGITEFSFITSSYDIGSFVTILFILIPFVHFGKISIRISLFSIFICNGIIQLSYTWPTTFVGMFVMRALNGMLGALAWTQITGSIGAYLQTRRKRTFGIIIHETSALLSTFSFVPIGYILENYSVNLCWYILCGISISFAIITCFTLPTTSVYDISLQKRIMSNASIYSVRRKTSELLQLKRSYHLYLLYIALILALFPYMMFYATFGGWLTQRFGLSPEELGMETLTLNLGELTALILTQIMIRYYSNASCFFAGSFGCCCVTVFLAIFLESHVYNEWLVIVLIYLYALFKDVIILNGIICTLVFSPTGYESICSLVFLLFLNLSSMVGTVIGPDIVNKLSFTALSRINAIIFLMQLLAAWFMTIQYNTYHRSLKRRYSLSQTLD